MKSTWSKHAHLWKFLTVIAVTFILSVVLFKAFGNPKQRLKKDSKPRVICSTEDTQETALLKEIRTNETVDLPSMSVLELWSREERTALYHRYINNIQYLCKSKVRLSKVIGSGWDICDEYTFRPIPPCLVYSFGVNNDFSFEDSVIERYRCEVHSFDKRMGKENHKRDSLHYLHAYDITAINNPALNYVPDLLTYNAILLKLGHTDKSLSILKMSIDSSEWDVLEELSDSKQLGTVDNLVVNFHLDNGASETSTSTYTKALTVLKKLHDSKFRIFWTRQNDSCAFVSKCRAQLRTNCHTVSFVRLR